MNPTPKPFYLPQLDGLRFVAFLLVFVHHAPLLCDHAVFRGLRHYGWIGVELFFCLSAYLFTKLLWLEHERHGRLRVWHFYLRRALRIWPLYFVFTGLMLGWTLWRMGLDGDTLLRGLGLFTFTDNLFCLGDGYNRIRHSSHLWTIAYEEQFYLVIPWLLAFLFGLPRGKALLVLVGLGALGMGARAAALAWGCVHPTVWVLPLTHFDGILVGLFIGLGGLATVRLPWAVWLSLGVCLLVTVALLPNVEQQATTLHLTYPLAGLGTGALLQAALCAPEGSLSRLLAWRPLAYLGKISYGLYVFHMLALGCAAGWLGQAPGTWLGALDHGLLPLVATGALAAASYHLLEKPFLRLKARFTAVASRPL